MGAALLGTGIGLTYAWVMTLIEWDYLARRRSRSGWPRSDLQWFLPVLLAFTAVFGWFAWRFFYG